MRTNRTSIIFVALLVTSGIILCGSTPTVASVSLSYTQGRVDLQADQAQLLAVLKELVVQAGLAVEVSSEIGSHTVTLQLDREELESALKRILKDVNYAALYVQENGTWRVTGLKVYPKGRFSGETRPLVAQSSTAALPAIHSTVLVGSGQEMVTFGAFGRQGVLEPSESIPTAQTDPSRPWVIMQAQLERQEAQAYENLLHLRAKLENAGDDDLESLSQIYNGEVENFASMKRGNLNKIESMKRIDLLQQATGVQE